MFGHPDLRGLGIRKCKLNQEISTGKAKYLKVTCPPDQEIPDTERCLVIQTWEVWASGDATTARKAQAPKGDWSSRPGGPGIQE